MPEAIRTQEFAQLVRSKRRGITVRRAAEDAGVSPATLWRVERGDPPKDVQVIRRLCDWLGVPTSRVMTSVPTRKISDDDEIEHGVRESTAAMIEAHLRADRDLDEETAIALAQAFRQLYEISRKKARREKE